MAKGKTSQPITIAVPTDWLDRPEIEALIQQGHQLIPMSFMQIDLILAPQAHMFNDLMLDYLPAALTAARKRKKENKK